MPTAQRGACCATRPARQRAAPVRLRRRHAAAAAAVGDRPARPAGDLPHALPRRPLPRPARDAEDVRAARPRRDAAHGLRARAAFASCSSGCIRSSAGSRIRSTLVELEAGERLERGDYAIEAFAVEHGAEALGYAIAEPERPGRFDVAAADALGVPDGPARGRLQAGQEVTVDSGRTVTPADVLGEPRPGRRIALHRRHRAVAGRRPGRPRRRPPRARGELPRRRGRARARDDALDGGRRPPRSRASRRCACLRSPMSRRATSARSSRTRRVRSSPTRSCRATST